MRNYLYRVRAVFFSEAMDLRVRIFNLLAISGILIGLGMGLLNSLTTVSRVGMLMGLAIAFLAGVLLLFSAFTGKYQFCYLVTIIVVFMLGFGVFFFYSGGYVSGMPSYFIFAMVYTAYMLDGSRMVVMIGLESLFYSGICCYAYWYGEKVTYFVSQGALLVDIVVCFLTVGLALSVTMQMQFKLYQNQERRYDEARAKAEEANSAKSIFLAKMSHEMRTPMNTIIGMNEMILRESTTEQMTAYSRDIQKAGDTMLELINNVLDITKIESGRLQRENKPYPLADLLEDLIMVGREGAERRKIDFSAEIDPQLPSVLVGDMTSIRQIITNFLSNALKYTEQGKIMLKVEAKPAEDADSLRLHLAVADTGIGIRQENFELIFEAFGRVEQPMQKMVEGTGLGLAIAKNLTEQMHGELTVESTWGKGSVFAVEIVQSVADGTPIGQWVKDKKQREPAYEESFLAPQGRVLLVDDNEENLWVVQSLLLRTLLKIDTARSGQEALQKLGEASYHVVLLDYMMPQMDGLETFRQMRRLYPDQDLPVIALTANAVSGTEERLKEAGFSGYLTKPLQWQSLEALLMAHLTPEMVTKTGFFVEEELVSKAQKQALADSLLTYDIILAEGLHFLSGDLAQYVKRAEFFNQRFDSARKRLDELQAGGDFRALGYELHSLKSSAHALGAIDLYYTAARMEKRCLAGDFSYTASAWPLLILEWERANKGLSHFREMVRQLVPALTETEKLAKKASVEDLRASLRLYQWKEALRALEGLKGNVSLTEDIKRLTAVEKAVNALCFEEALALLVGWEEGEQDAR